jgi:hypothetical protein
MKDTIKLLRKAGVQFRYYAQQHLAKANRLTLSTHEWHEARKKSDINLRLAEEIEDHLLAIESAAAPPSEDYMPKPITE